MTDAKKLSREERRARMPEVSAVVDEFTAEFGAVTVEYAEEGGLVWGKKPPEVRAVKLSDMELWSAVQRQGEEERERRGVGRPQSRANARDQARVRSAGASAAPRGAIGGLSSVAQGSKG